MLEICCVKKHQKFTTSTSINKNNYSADTRMKAALAGTMQRKADEKTNLHNGKLP